MADSSFRLTQARFLNSPSDRLLGTSSPIGQFERYFENPYRLFVNELLIDTKVSLVPGIRRLEITDRRLGPKSFSGSRSAHILN